MLLARMPEIDRFAMTAIDLGGKPPTEVQLMPMGRWDGYVHPYTGELTSFEVTREHIDAAVEYNAERKRRNPARDLVIDYEHQTLHGGVAPAAGFIADLKGSDDGLDATGVRWTAKAAAYISAGEYRYISPVFGFDRYDKVTGNPVRMIVHNAGITNEPFFDELKPLVSKDNSHSLYFFSKEVQMNKAIEFLLAFLAMASGSTPEQIAAKAHEFAEQLKSAGVTAKDGAEITAKAVIDRFAQIKSDLEKMTANYTAVAKALDANETDPPEKLTVLIAAKADTSAYVTKTEYNALRTQLQSREIDDVFNAAKSLGKISPASEPELRKWAEKDLAGFKAFLAKVADYSVVPLQHITVADAKPAKEKLSEEEVKIAKALGVDPKKLVEEEEAEAA